MALFRRNVVGSDILSLWTHVNREGPIGRDKLVRRFYPGDSASPDESDSRKPLNDAIDFLVETDQIVKRDEGFTLTSMAQSEDSAETALLRGIRSREGTDAAYNDVLDVLTEENWVYFDRGASLEDLLSDRRSEVTWNSTRLNYWRRTMEAVGVVRDVNTDADESHTSMLCIEQGLLYSLLTSVASTNEPVQFRETIQDVNDHYLPMFTGANREKLAIYAERAIQLARQNDIITLGQDSDFGPQLEVGEAGYNALTLKVTGTP